MGAHGRWARLLAVVLNPADVAKAPVTPVPCTMEGRLVMQSTRDNVAPALRSKAAFAPRVAHEAVPPIFTLDLDGLLVDATSPVISPYHYLRRHS